jgi:predicted nucleotidyltransferase
LDKKTVIKIVDQFYQGIKARGIKPQKLILYGSYASGIHAEGSDIDLVVISDDFIGKDYWDRIEILSDTIYEIFAPIEAVAMTQEEWDRGDSFVTDFARNGEVLFAA